MSEPVVTRKEIEESITALFQSVSWEQVPLTVGEDKEAIGVIYKSKETGQSVGVVIVENHADRKASFIKMLTILHDKRFGVCVLAGYPEYLPGQLKKMEALAIENPVMPGDLEGLKCELTRDKSEKPRND